jgi:HNH endonuclease
MARRGIGEYVPLSVSYMDDDALLGCSPLAELLYVRMLAVAGRMPTDGYLTLPQIEHRAGARLGTPAKVRALLKELVAAGPVEEVDGGYAIRAWLKWNKSAEELGREKSRDRDRKAALTETVRRSVYERDGHACRYCSATADLALDHVLPLYLGGTHAIENLQTLCAACNTRKGRRDATGMIPEQARAAFNIQYGSPPAQPPPSPDSRNHSRAAPVSQPASSRAIPVSRATAHARHDTALHDTAVTEAPLPRADNDPLPVPLDDPPADSPPTAQSLVGEWLDHCAVRPPGRTLGHVAKLLGEMLTEGVPAAVVRVGLANWHSAAVADPNGRHPSTLPGFVHAAANGGTAYGPTAGPGGRRPSTTDQRVRDHLDMAAQLRAEEAAEPPPLRALPGGAA